MAMAAEVASECQRHQKLKKKKAESDGSDDEESSEVESDAAVSGTGSEDEDYDRQKKKRKMDQTAKKLDKILERMDLESRGRSTMYSGSMAMGAVTVPASTAVVAAPIPAPTPGMLPGGLPIPPVQCQLCNEWGHGAAVVCQHNGGRGKWQWSSFYLFALWEERPQPFSLLDSTSSVGSLEQR
jgi:hypothetical protein